MKAAFGSTIGSNVEQRCLGFAMRVRGIFFDRLAARISLSGFQHKFRSPTARRVKADKLFATQEAPPDANADSGYDDARA
jgi:hypothetical protein